MTPSLRMTITNGPITAGIQMLEDGVAFCAPITYNGVTLVDAGSWAYGIDVRDTTLLGQALDDCVTSLVTTTDNTSILERWAQALAA